MRRSTSTAAQTIANASSVPIATSWLNTSIGMRPAAIATTVPVSPVVIAGVRSW
ncbi:MAG: hypothetical protein ACT4PJ_14850 [Gemmatimonadaceae bacterium]